MNKKKSWLVAQQADVLLRYTIRELLAVVKKKSVIMRYKLPELIKKVLTRRTPLLRSHVSSITWAGSRTLLSHSHVSSMTDGCTCPIY